MSETILTTTGSLAAGLAVMLLFIVLYRRVERLALADAEIYAERLRALFVRSFSGRKLALLQYVGSFLVLIAVFLSIGNVFVAVVVAGACFVTPKPILLFLQARRLDRFDAQLIDGTLSLANSLRSGLVLPQALKLMADSSEPPLSEEFGQTMREYDHGKPIAEALESMRRRVPSQPLQLLLLTVEVARAHGGDLPRILETISTDLREMHHVSKKVQTVTAEGRLQAKALAAAPAALGLMMFVAQPEMQIAFYRSTPGKVTLVLAALLTVAGFLWMRKIVDIDI